MPNAVTFILMDLLPLFSKLFLMLLWRVSIGLTMVLVLLVLLRSDSILLLMIHYCLGFRVRSYYRVLPLYCWLLLVAPSGVIAAVVLANPF